jgi:hypothetical protein
MFASPLVLLIDMASYFWVWTLPPVPVGAMVPQLTEGVIARVQPRVAELIERPNKSEPLEKVAASIGARASVTPRQVVRFVQALAAQSNGSRG